MDRLALGWGFCRVATEVLESKSTVHRVSRGVEPFWDRGRTRELPRGGRRVKFRERVWGLGWTETAGVKIFGAPPLAVFLRAPTKVARTGSRAAFLRISASGGGPE